MFVFFHYLLWKAKLDFDCLEPKDRLVVYQRFIRSGFHCLLWRYENPSLHYTVPLCMKIREANGAMDLVICGTAVRNKDEEFETF